MSAAPEAVGGAGAGGADQSLMAQGSLSQGLQTNSGDLQGGDGPGGFGREAEDLDGPEELGGPGGPQIAGGGGPGGGPGGFGGGLGRRWTRRRWIWSGGGPGGPEEAAAVDAKDADLATATAMRRLLATAPTAILIALPALCFIPSAIRR